MSEIKFVNLNPVEASRVYTFPGGDTVTLNQVAKIAVSQSGTHRLETEDGKKHIIPPGWIHIHIDVKEWTF